MSEIFSDKIEELLGPVENKSSIVEMLPVRSGHKKYIYGAGNVGSTICRLLQDAEIPVEAFFDRRGGDGHMHMGKMIYTISHYKEAKCDREKDVVIIALICSAGQLGEIKQQLSDLGFKNIITFHTIYSLLIRNNLVQGESSSFSISDSVTVKFNEVRERVNTVAGLWADKESRTVYLNFLKALLYAAPNEFSLPTNQPQYFVNDIEFSKGFSRFIDCGAFDGDTMIDLNKHKGTVDAVACFEPDNDNFLKLCWKRKEKRIAREHIMIPCGVWKKSAMLRFRSGGQSESSISAEGDTFIQGVAIDDVIPDFNPTFIKMDVEGAEYEALLGARNTIIENKPDLAISVYHRMEHIWEIPLLVEGFVPGYKFYLRCHGENGLETIMYAVSQ